MFENLVLKEEKEMYELLNSDASRFFTLRESVIATIRNFDISINDSILEQLLLYVEVMTIRLLDGKTIDADELDLSASSFEYILSEKIVLQVESYSSRTVNRQERSHMTG